MKKFIPIPLVILSLAVILTPLFAQSVFKDAAYQVCFMPGQNCTGEIVEAIQQAKQSIRVQVSIVIEK